MPKVFNEYTQYKVQKTQNAESLIVNAENYNE